MPPSSKKEAIKPAAIGPSLKFGGSRVLTGTCSWTDPTLVKEADWYPKKSMSAAERLAFYASRFPLVEVDSTYYRPPGEQLARSWAERTPDDFTFDVKAYSLLTHHPTNPDSLWPDIKDAIKPDFVGKRTVYAEHLEADAFEEAWLRFAHALHPLVDAGRFGAVLLQYPEWFTPKRANRDELVRARQRLGDLKAYVEFRSPRWLADDDRDRTVEVLREQNLVLTVVDAPPVSGLPTVVATTSPDLGAVRFHGRANDTWKKRDISAAERFRYLYDRTELEEWVPRVRQLAAEAGEVHLLMNNCYQDYGVRNAADLYRILAEID